MLHDKIMACISDVLAFNVAAPTKDFNRFNRI